MNVGSEDDLFCHGVALVPPLLVDVDVTDALHLFDELVDLDAVRYVEEQVKLLAPLDLDPRLACVINDGLDDVVLLDLPHLRNGSLLLFLGGRSGSGLDVGHGILRVWRA